MKICGGKKGFTVVELMIAAAGAAILVLIVALILFMSYREWRASNDYARLRRDTAFAVQLMAKEIRNSSSTGIFTAANSLILQTNAAYTITFTRNAASNLTYLRNGTVQGLLITKGLKTFNPQKLTLMTNRVGVLLELVLVNTDGDISITNKTFISTRNPVY